MDPKELRGLMEAYSEVYSPKENIEEGLRSAVKRLLGGGKKEAEAPKPESRGDQLRARYNVGPEKSDTSAKRKILDRAKGNAERAQKQVDMGNASQSYASKAKDAHNKYLKAGYSKYGADAPYQGRGNKARKRAAALNAEDFEFIVNALIEEGYDLSSYTWDEMYDICLDENRMASRMEKMPSAPAKVGKATHSTKDLAPSKEPTPEEKAKARKALGLGEKVDLFDTVLEFLQVEGFAETLEEAEWLMANVIDEEAIDIILDEVTSADYMSLAKTKKPRSVASIQARAHASRLNKPEKETGKKSSRPSSPLRSKMTQDTRDAGRLAAEYGSYDEPGYGSSSKGSLPKGKKLERQKATGVSEAQEARNNPEKYEREQSKKSAPVRGERTPMPPRGDKRREDFEKWYAANVR